MYCPHTIVFDSKFVMIIRHENGDYYRGTPFLERVNLLRYELTIVTGAHHFVINRNGRLALHWANLNWFLWKRHLWKAKGY
jgi:hypothetical protein